MATAVYTWTGPDEWAWLDTEGDQLAFTEREELGIPEDDWDRILDELADEVADGADLTQVRIWWDGVLLWLTTGGT